MVVGLVWLDGLVGLVWSVGLVWAPEVVGGYVHEHIAGSTLVRLAATGPCPNLSAPEETTAAMLGYLRRLPAWP